MTAATEYVCVEPAQAPMRIPEIAPGVPGELRDTTARQDVLLLPHALEARTQIFPEEAAPLLRLKVIEVLPCPAVIVYPEGAVQM